MITKKYPLREFSKPNNSKNYVLNLELKNKLGKFITASMWGFTAKCYNETLKVG